MDTIDMHPIAFTPNAPFDEASLLAWLEAARPGDRAVYHVGQLCIDRMPGFSRLPPRHRDALAHLADLVMAQAHDGRLLPVQQRLDDGRTAYLAVKTSRHPTRRSS